MPIPNERAPFDAPASIDTGYCFVPNADGSFSAATKNNTFEGTLDTKHDVDWIIIELQAGKEYTFTLTGDGEGHDTLEDPILMLRDSKGGEVMSNDDIDGPDGNLDSHIVLPPLEEDGKFYLSVSAYTGNPGQSNKGAYTLTVTERPAGPADIMGTVMADKLHGTDGGEIIDAMEGNDVIYAGGGDDEIEAGDGNDLIMGGAGADTIDGGAGTDTVTYKGSAAAPGPGEDITINLYGNLASGGHATGDSLKNIENVIGAMYAENMLTGDRGDNLLEGGMFEDVLIGDRGDDHLLGHAGDDRLEGEDGNDTLEGGYGADKLIGGDGDDTASYSGSMMGVTVRFHSLAAMHGDAEGDSWNEVTVEYDNPDPDASADERTLEETVPDIINLTGSGMADILAGDSRANTIKGGGGDDRIYGGPGGGDDMLHGDSGNDMVFGGLGNDTLMGGMGNDMLWGGPGADKSFGGPGSDMIYSDLMDDVRDGGEDMNGLDRDTLSFEKLADKPVGTNTAAFTLGGVNVEYDPATSQYGTWDRTAEDPDDHTFTPTSGIDAVGFEHVIGSDEDDFITGSDTAMEEIDGHDGGDTLVGGTGAGDTVSYENSDSRVRVDLGDGTTGDTNGSRTSGGHATGDTISGFENIKGSAHNDILTARSDDTNDDASGNQGSTLWGLDGDDEIIGRGGSDTIEGGAGADELDGGTSDASTTDNADMGADTAPDTLSYAASDAGVSVNLANNSVSGGHAEGDELEVQEAAYDHDGDEETDMLDVSTFENVTGSMHDDRLTGDHRDNVLTGHAGNDTLRGLAGADRLIGGPGADVLDGGEERNDDNSVVDVASYAGARAGVTVDLHSRKGTGGDADGDTYRNIERYEGSSNDDTFIASEGVDVIDAGMNDADDRGKSTDGDTISYEESETKVTINLETLSTTPEVAGNADENEGRDENYAEGDNLMGFENVTGSQFGDMLTALTASDGVTGSTLKGLGGNDTLTGGDGKDILIGDGGRDEITGGGSDDRIVGGSGDDVMTGGAGDDTFVFSPGDGAGVDIIKDFRNGSSGEDKLDFTAFGIRDPEDLAANISWINDDVRIDLTPFGGGIIILEGDVDLDDLDVPVAQGGPDEGNEIDEAGLNVGADGVFIL